MGSYLWDLDGLAIEDKRITARLAFQSDTCES